MVDSTTNIPFEKGVLVRWTDNNNCPHVGEVIEVFRDTVVVQYGSGNRTQKKRFLASQVDEANLRDKIKLTPRELRAKAREMSTKPGWEWAAALYGSEAASSSPRTPVLRAPKHEPDDNLMERAEEFIRNNPGGVSRSQIMAHLGMSESDVPAYMALMATLLDEKRVVKTGAKRGTRYHTALATA